MVVTTEDRPDPFNSAGRRSRRPWGLAIGFALSLCVNFGLAGYLYLFVPNSPFRPLCDLPTLETRELRGEMTREFERRLSPGLSYYGIRVGPDGGRLYVARWERWFDYEMLSNNSNKAARWLYEDRGGKLDEFGRITCEEVRKIAIIGAE